MTGTLVAFVAIASAAVILGSCAGNQENAPGMSREPVTDSVVLFNQGMVKSEIREIEDFISRYRWEMNTTETGLRYMIYKHGNGPQAGIGDSVSVRFRITLLNGDSVYNTGQGRPVTLELGKRKVPSGFEEGLMLMNQGDRAKLIVPSHLAYGVLGDLDKIPSRATLVFDVELCSVISLKK